MFSVQGEWENMQKLASWSYSNLQKPV